MIKTQKNNIFAQYFFSSLRKSNAIHSNFLYIRKDFNCLVKDPKFNFEMLLKEENSI